MNGFGKFKKTVTENTIKIHGHRMSSSGILWTAKLMPIFALFILFFSLSLSFTPIVLGAFFSNVNFNPQYSIVLTLAIIPLLILTIYLWHGGAKIHFHINGKIDLKLWGHRQWEPRVTLSSITLDFDDEKHPVFLLELMVNKLDVHFIKVTDAENTENIAERIASLHHLPLEHGHRYATVTNRTAQKRGSKPDLFKNRGVEKKLSKLLYGREDIIWHGISQRPAWTSVAFNFFWLPFLSFCIYILVYNFPSSFIANPLGTFWNAILVVMALSGLIRITWALFANWKPHYVLTDERILIVTQLWPHISFEITPVAIRRLYVSQRSGNYGTVQFYDWFVFGGFPPILPLKLVNIKEPERVERLIRDTLNVTRT